jgi:pyridoxamine 5'-phosphate oxidase
MEGWALVNQPDAAAMRRRYDAGTLDESAAQTNWYAQFTAWFSEAVRSQGDAAADSKREANAMQVATVDAMGRPAVRTVLLKGFDDRGVVFYTDYRSAKGRDLTHTPRAAAVLYWSWLERQVRLSGDVERVSERETAEYFASRPRGSRLAAWASPQSAVIEDRHFLETRVEQVSDKFADLDVPSPPYWGGFRIVVDEVEFWQGRPDRLHDRLRYRQADGEWLRERLAP